MCFGAFRMQGMKVKQKHTITKYVAAQPSQNLVPRLTAVEML